MLDQSRVVIPERFRNHPLFNELHRGMNFGFMAKRGYYAREDVKRQPALMAAAGVNWTTLNANLCQETYASRKVFLDFRFSSGETELTEIMKILHDHGLRILLKPCLTPLDGAWMGSVTFPTTHQIAGVSHDYWTDWFQSFGESAKYFAEFAEQNQVEGLIIGAEYFGTEGQSEHWRQVIADIRDIYSGPLTYEFTHESRKHYPLDWFDELDFLSYSYYPPAPGRLDRSGTIPVGAPAHRGRHGRVSGTAQETDRLHFRTFRQQADRLYGNRGAFGPRLRRRSLRLSGPDRLRRRGTGELHGSGFPHLFRPAAMAGIVLVEMG